MWVSNGRHFFKPVHFFIDEVGDFFVLKAIAESGKEIEIKRSTVEDEMYAVLSEIEQDTRDSKEEVIEIWED